MFPFRPRLLLLILVAGMVCWSVSSSEAQTWFDSVTCRDFALDLKATPSTTSPHITLSWVPPSGLQDYPPEYQRVYRRAKGAPAGTLTNPASWTLQATLNPADTTWADPTAEVGVEYEYWLDRLQPSFGTSPVIPPRPIAFLMAGVEVPPIEQRGTVLLVVDDTMTTPLGPEIALLVEDLNGDGWKVQTIPVPRTDSPPAVRARIQAAAAADPSVKAVYLLGRVPVPYMGVWNPDGHGQRTFAADGYYGDLDGTYTDTTVNSSNQAFPSRTHNVPGDGKFDQGGAIGWLELQVGRVDLFQMTQAPASSVSETTLLRRYLRKAHDYRHRLGAYASVPRHSMMRDGFGFNGLNDFASGGWAAAFSTVGSEVDVVAKYAWFTQAASQTYLFGYGNGPGGYDRAYDSVGNSADFGRRPSRVVFTLLFGSYFVDWDTANNFLRAPLAGNASGDSLGLTSFWSGYQHFHLHPAGLGETIGYAARYSMNSSAARSYFALMGDPTLRLHMVEPPRNLAATTAGSSVTLRWNPSTETALLGYHVYRAPAPAGDFVRLTGAPLTTAGYTDSTGAVGQSYRYMVRTLKRETVPGGSYQNLSQGAHVTLTVSSAATGAPFSPGGLTAQAIASQQVVLNWTDNSADETQFRIEKRLPNGTWSQIASVGANVTTFTDPSLQVSGGVSYYRVIAGNAAGLSPPSNVASVETSAGFIEVGPIRSVDSTATPLVKVARTSGSVAVEVTRFGANINAVSVQAATGNVSAIAGTHYTPWSGPVNFANGANGTQNIHIPLTTGGPPQLPRQFNVVISNPQNSVGLTSQTLARVLIEDPAATLPAPWQQTILGTVNDSSPAVFAENAIGSAVVGGRSNTSDQGRFVYQSRSGDGVITAFIDAPLPAQNGARFAVMVRGTTSSGVAMASAQVAGSSTVGTNLAVRTSTSGQIALTPGGTNNQIAPRWVRLTRSGNLFTAETSTNGGVWTLLGSATVNVPTNAHWGLFHHSDSASPQNFQLARFRFVTITNPGVLSAPTGFTATPQAPASIALTWDPVGGATAYELERRPRNGTYALHQTLPQGTTSFVDAVLPGVLYEYRLRATQGALVSPTLVRSATAPGTPTPYQQWLQTHGLPMDGSGNGAPEVSLPNDGIPNTMKFALGLSPQIRGYFGRLVFSRVESGGQFFNALTYLRPEPIPAGNVYAVQMSGNLGAWSDSAGLEIANSVAGGFRTITIRDTIPASLADPQRFIRLEVTVP